ncbi:MAG TPA: diguanylate cyclase, partial [Anaerolineales bacterium]|nr:diguanylate cyclase [Anaerolineales bacterium]
GVLYNLSMLPPNVLYSAILLAAGVGCLVVAVAIWLKRREAIGAKSLFVFLLGLSWWDITYGIFWADIPGPNPYFWLDITLFGAFVVPTAFLIFALEYSNSQKWLGRPFIIAAIIEPILISILLCTDRWHNLYFGGVRALNTTMLVEMGPAAWANVVYSYLLILIGVLVLAVTLYRSRGVYRMQVTFILAATVTPWVIHILFLSIGDHALLPDADVTPFIFSMTALLIAYALIRYRLLDVVPIARSILIESMSEGVCVLDSQNRIVDINQTARKALSSEFFIGQPVEQAFKCWIDIVSHFFDQETAQTEVVIDDRYLDLRISPVYDKNQRLLGKLVVWRDITELKNTQLKLQQLATIDELTLAFNRRHFMEIAEVQFSQALRQNQPFALALIDLDYFKGINDKYGHPAGDQVLAEFSRMFMENIRKFDVFGRLGGEEFALLMPNTDIHFAYHASERLRFMITNTPIPINGGDVIVTFSLGVAMLQGAQDTLSAIFRRADLALYAAKNSGRNQVKVWEQGLEAVAPKQA